MLNGRRFVIGDIHGCIRTFRKLVEEKMCLQRHDRLWLLGDMIDRGPDSRAVIDYVLKLRMMSITVVPLMGNHEFMMLNATRQFVFFRLWMENAGDTTLQNFGINKPHQSSMLRIPGFYIEFLKNLPMIAETPGYILVHAGIDPSGCNPHGDTETLLWTRNPCKDFRYLGNRKLIYGHTPTPLCDIMTIVDNPSSRVIPLDGGCVYHTRTGLGHLVGLNLDTLELFYQKNEE